VDDERFFTMLAEYGNPDTALALTAAEGVSRDDLKRRRASDAEFEQRYDEAMHRFYARLEKEALRRAVEGVPQPQFYRGVLVDADTVRKFSDKMLILLLQRHIPEYRQKVTVEQTGEGFHPDLTEQMQDLDPEDRKALRAILAKLEKNK